MSFLRHRRSIIRWVLLGKAERGIARSAPPLIGLMSRNRLFLGELLSSRARLRFTGWLQFPPASRNCKP